MFFSRQPLFRLHNLPDLLGQLFDAEGLLDKPVASPGHDLGGLSIDTVAGGENHLHPGLNGPQRIEDFSSAHPPA